MVANKISSVNNSLPIILSVIVLLLMPFIPDFYDFTVAQKSPQTVQLIPKVAKNFPEKRKDAIEPNLTANSIYVVDLQTGKVLLSKKAEEPILPASTTKMVTALVAIEAYDLNQVFTAGKIGVGGHKVGLVQGEQITVRDLLNGLLIASGNDAAEVLAVNYPGGRGAFVLEMNDYARSLGLVNTNFKNPTGLDEFLHFSTAKDLATIAVAVIKNPVFAQIVATKEMNTVGLNMKAHRLVSTNLLLGKVSGVAGVKTGQTFNSGGSVVTYINRDNKRVMIALIGSVDRFGETETLIDWIFKNYDWGEEVAR